MGNKMVSIITMAANALGGLLVSALRAFFSLISWFLKHFFNCIKLLFCALPVTTVVFTALFAVNIFLLVTGPFRIPEADQLSKEGIAEVNSLLEGGLNTTFFMYRELLSWWNETVYVLKGSVGYILLLLVTVLMFLPVVSILLCISVFASYAAVLFMAVCVDGAVYVIFMILGKSAVRQLRGRYFLLFREAGKKHDEKTYEKWLRRHHDEFEKDEYEQAPRRSRVDEFYEDEEYYEDEPDYEDDEYYEDEAEYEDDEYYEDELDYEDDEYYEDESDYNDEEYEDEEYEDEEDEEDEEDNRQNTQSPPPVNSSSAFDFFAGCNSRESLDRKYKSLVKLYHPDNMDGDTRAIQEINVQYDNAKKSGRF